MFVYLDDQKAGTARAYEEPLDVVSASDPLEVPGALAKLEAYRREGKYLAGWLAYELGAAVEPALAHTLSKTDTPLLQVGVFDGYGLDLPLAATRSDAVVALEVEAAWSEAEYAAAFRKVQEYVAAGDVYQVNLAFPMRGRTDLDALALYRNLRRRQVASFCGVASLGGPEIVSLSPELFLRIEQGRATLKPMKGTLPRMDDPLEDAAAREAMTEDIKSRAENLMIVDLLRNDLSRIAKPGTVKVPTLFEAETYDTVHQMTSTITGHVGNPSLGDIVAALFPCGSVTGAPKIRAMEIIHDLEPAPRGPYCGSMFYHDPDGTACFNVAIRTLVKAGEDITYWVGSGIVADSVAGDEYRECLLKARVLQPRPPSLIETMRLGPKGFVRLPRHLNRLERSAREMGYAYNFHKIADALTQVEPDREPQRIRIELFPDARAHIVVTPLAQMDEPVRVVAGSRPLTPEVQPSAHKIGTRYFYESELDRARAQGADEVILLNPDGEVAEGSYTSVFAEIEGKLLTPPLSSGGLPGVLREHLLEEGRAEEQVLEWGDLLEADALYVGNSLRGLMLAVIV